ncbi:MAG TPA: alpha-amylase/4-alpha-glucanotransferase domain-containing protein, partial [Burkholderiales bacterium]|nr:alpha-amylase/4-alpha-glucanotransferase domain-containing protein [Burkholderiales bacterium]
GRVIVHNEILGGFGLPHNLSLCKGLILEDEVLGGRIALRFSRPLSVSLTPFHTVSQSEAGFEKIMQALTVSLKTEVHDKEWVEIQLVFEKKSLGY